MGEILAGVNLLKILRKELYQRLSNQTSIISPRTHHAFFQFELLFNHIQFTEFFATAIHYKVLSN